MSCDVSCRPTYGSFLLHSHIWASSLFCLKVAVMSCLLGSLWNKGRRPLRSSDAASSNCVRFRFLQERRLQHSLEHPRALEKLWVLQIQQSSLCSRLVFVSAWGHRHRSPMAQRTDPLRARAAFSLSTLCLCAGWGLFLGLSPLCLVSSPPSLSFPAALWRRGWMVIGQRVGAPAALFGSPWVFRST